MKKTIILSLMLSGTSLITNGAEWSNFIPQLTTNVVSDALWNITFLTIIRCIKGTFLDPVKGVGETISNDLIEGIASNPQGTTRIVTNFSRAVEANAQNIGAATQATTGSMLRGLGQGLLDAEADPNGPFRVGTQAFLARLKTEIGAAIDETFARANKHFAVSCAIVVAAVTAGLTVKQVIPHVVGRLYRPTLIIESSEQSTFTKIKSFFKTAPKPQPQPMELNPALKERSENLIKAAQTIHQKKKKGRTNAFFRNALLYGPPGTGKTMLAKEIARRSGLKFAMMSGASFSKFKSGEGIEELDKLFAWANQSDGVLIFIDEAETFLSKRENMDPQSKAYKLLNNFLNYTGTRSSQFMLVFATNHKDALDSAMYRRIDDLIEMPLPSKAQRINTLLLYKEKILMDEKQNEASLVESARAVLTDALIQTIAEKTKGLSYSDLEGIINIIKTDTDILSPALVTQELVMSVVNQAITKHQAFTNGKTLGFVED